MNIENQDGHNLKWRPMGSPSTLETLVFPRDVVKGMKNQGTDLEKVFENTMSHMVFYQRYIER